MLTARNLGLMLLVAAFTATFTLWVQAENTSPEPADVAGTWAYTVQGRNGEATVTITLEQDGDKLTGSVTGFGGQDNPITEGSVDGDTITFQTAGGGRGAGDGAAGAGNAGGAGGGGGQGPATVNVYTATLEGGKLVGKVETIRTREFEATRG